MRCFYKNLKVIKIEDEWFVYNVNNSFFIGIFFSWFFKINIIWGVICF